MNVSREEAVRFLECATRNWSKVPPLSEDDLGDVATELLRFAIAKRKEDLPAVASVGGSPLLDWAVSKWNSEVKNRPLANVHRRSLDDTWRQVIRWAGGDPDALLGPSHDALLSALAASGNGSGE
nr:hypothetical protein [uncultured Shinella sp.]